MKRTFFLNLVFLIGINLLIKPLYVFGIDRGIQNAVSTSTYGLYFELFNFTFLFQILNDFGIQYYANRYISHYPFLIKKYFPYFLGAKGVLSVLYLTVVLAFGIAAGYFKLGFDMLFLLAVVQFLTSLLTYIRSNISGLGWYFTDSVLSILDKLILILLLGIPLWSGFFEDGFSIIWFGYMQMVSVCIPIVIGLIVLFPETGFPRPRLNWRLNFLIIKQSIPYALAVILMTIYNRIDAVMLGRMLENGQEAVGRYAAAYRLLDAVNMIGFLFAGLLLPMYARLHKEKQDLNPLSDLGIRLLWSGVLVFTPTVMVFSEPIMEGLYEHTTGESSILLSLLMLSFIPASGGYIFSSLLLAAGHQQKLNWIYLAGAILSIVLNSLLIPSMGAIGAAWIAVATQFFVFGGVLYGCWVWEGVYISRILWLKFLGVVLGIALLGDLIKQAYHAELGWWAPIIVCMFGVLIVFGLHLVAPVDMLRLLRKEEKY